MSPRGCSIRPAVTADLPALRDIEWAAGQRYREVELPHIADDEPASIEVLTDFALDGRAWVATGDAGQAVGYVLVEVVDGAAHIEQVSVAPDHQGWGVGRALIDQVRRWASAHRLAALTLTTFDDVPWNRPLYEHLGFHVLAEEEIGPGLQALRRSEAELGLDADIRVAMRCDVCLAGKLLP